MHKLLSVVILLVAFGNATAQPATGTSALDWAKKKCTDIGFKAGTERFGNCVLQLSRSDETFVTGAGNSKSLATTASQIPVQESKRGLATYRDCDECPEMVVIPAGKFLMGSKDDPFANPRPSKDEMPQHEVSLKSFSMGKYEITQEQWYVIMGTLPSKFKGRTLPVEQVSWDEAQEFVKKLSEKTGKLYRLPSEAEWEYAARAGSQNSYSFADNVGELNAFAWFNNNADRQTHPVGEKSPNAFGLFDMHGNVWEWVQDRQNESYVGAPSDGSAWATGANERVLRGGSWSNYPQHLRSAVRNRAVSGVRYSDFGFRVARDN